MKRHKVLIIIILIACTLVSCIQDVPEEEPSYTAKIAWDSGAYSNYAESYVLDGDYIYFYERPADKQYFGIFMLTKLDARTGVVVWRSFTFNNIQLCQPAVLDGYVYVFLGPNKIYCFDQETGKLSARVQVDIDNQNLEMVWNSTGYGDHLYFSFIQSNKYKGLVRLDTKAIDRDGNPESLQVLSPEIIWRPVYARIVTARPVVYNNVVYTATMYSELFPDRGPVEIVGIDLDTQEVVFYQEYGISDDGTVYDNGVMRNPIFIHDDVLYYLSWSIAAYNLKTGKLLYRHIFDLSDGAIPKEQQYGAANTQQAVYYRGKIYYTTGSGNLDGASNDYRNIHCIDAATGKLVWNDIAKGSESLETNPIIAHDRLYIAQSVGLRVYNPETGKLIGVDKNFIGEGMGRNLLYKDYLICERYPTIDHGAGTLVAIDVSR
jgi:outer membrane protein assembly factor BamB